MTISNIHNKKKPRKTETPNHVAHQSSLIYLSDFVIDLFIILLCVEFLQYQHSIQYSLHIVDSNPPTPALCLSLLFPYLHTFNLPGKTGDLGKEMCPLRFILVFFSAILAGYFAWRSFRSSPDELDAAFSEDLIAEKSPVSRDDDKQERNLKLMIQNGFWAFVDMASGRYLWRNFKEMKKTEEKVKASQHEF